VQTDAVKGRGPALLLEHKFVNAMRRNECSWYSDGGERFWSCWSLSVADTNQTHDNQ